MIRPSWDEYFMDIAELASSRSHDPDTKHGCVLVDPRNVQVGMGYNGYPRGCGEEQFPDSRPEKYDYMLHAETNAILNSGDLSRLCGGTAYVTGMPCSRCLLELVQVGIKRIVVGSVESACVTDTRPHERILAASRVVMERV